MKDDLLMTPTPKVNPLKYPSVKCDNCGGEVFEEKYIIKKIPGMIVGNGTEDITYPIPVLVCSKCGTIEKTNRELIEKGNKYQEEHKENNGGLII